MNDFLKDLIKSVDEIEDMSLTEALERLDDIEKKYNEHIIKKKLEDNRLLRKELTAVQDELRRLKEDEHPTQVFWEKNLNGEPYQLWYSKNTVFYFEINEIKEELYELSIFDKRTSVKTLSCHDSESDCKNQAKRVYNDFLKGKLNTQSQLEWKVSLSDIGKHIEESTNTLLHCRIEEMTIGYKLTCIEPLGEITHINSCESIDKCKQIAEKKFVEMINRKL